MSPQLTLAEVAELLRCSKRTVRRRIASGRLPASREGGRILVAQADVEALLVQVAR